MTLQLGESHEGLRIAPDRQSELQPVKRGAKNAILFAASNMPALLGPDTIYQPAWHDVLKVDRLNQGQSMPGNVAQACARWAIIFFASGRNLTVPPKADMHNR